MKKLGIYVHVPFCRQKCNYCDFYSLKWDCETENKYIESILNEINSYKSILVENYRVDTVFFGGGTPTIIKTDNVERIIDGINNLFSISENSEITIEANPNTLTDDNLKSYKKMGINRLSIGIQSLNDEILKKIGRIHNSEEALESIDRAKENGIENINADVMFNIPGQNVNNIEYTLSKIIERNVNHISFYSLKLEKGTPLYLMEKNNKISMPEEDDERNMYYAGRNIMENNNFMQYEISNFALRGYECRHNLKYWNQEEYIGFGPSAHSFLNNIRYSNPSDLVLYCDNMWTNKTERIIQEELNKEELMFEYIMLRLRLTEGIFFSEFNNKFCSDFIEVYKKQIDYLNDNKLIALSENNMKLTKKGMDISNFVIEQFS